MSTPTKLIREFSEGNPAALNQLFELIYDELHMAARLQRKQWNGLRTMDTMALIHETYLKLRRNHPRHLANRKHFLALASKAMRQILINYAGKKSAQKRGGDRVPLDLDEVSLSDDNRSALELLEIHRILNRLEEGHPRQCQVFECRFFGGMTVEDTAFALNISPATVKRDWQAVCNRIYRDLHENRLPGK